MGLSKTSFPTLAHLPAVPETNGIKHGVPTTLPDDAEILGGRWTPLGLPREQLWLRRYRASCFSLTRASATRTSSTIMSKVSAIGLGWFGKQSPLKQAAVRLRLDYPTTQVPEKTIMRLLPILALSSFCFDQELVQRKGEAPIRS
jgi:hypothetical protein